MARRTPVLLFELRTFLRRRTYQITTAAFPVLGIGLLLIVRLIAALVEAEEPEVREYVDQWGQLPVELPIELHLRSYASQEEARAALLDNEIEAYLSSRPTTSTRGSSRSTPRRRAACSTTRRPRPSSACSSFRPWW